MEFHFGKKVMQYRKKNNMTIQELAKRTQLSNAAISQIERGIGNPTYSVLQALAMEMNISVSSLVMDEIKNEDLVLRKGCRKIMHDTDHGFVLYSLLTESPAHNNMDMIYIYLAPHCDTTGGYWVHPEEECVYVMSGEVKMEFDDEVICLHAGDTIRVLPGRKHLLRNDSNEEAYLINVKCKVTY